MPHAIWYEYFHLDNDNETLMCTLFSVYFRKEISDITRTLILSDYYD